MGLLGWFPDYFTDIITNIYLTKEITSIVSPQISKSALIYLNILLCSANCHILQLPPLSLSTADTTPHTACSLLQAVTGTRRMSQYFYTKGASARRDEVRAVSWVHFDYCRSLS